MALVPNCHGLGSLRTFAPDLVVPDQKATVGVRSHLGWIRKIPITRVYFTASDTYGFHLHDPWNQLTAEQQRVILYGYESNRILMKNREAALISEGF